MGAIFVFSTVQFTYKTIIRLHRSHTKGDIARKKILLTKTFLLNSFARFVPSQFIKHVGEEDVTYIKPGRSVSKVMTTLFCDMRDFTAFSHEIPSKEAFHLLNHCYERLIPAIEKNNGFVDKFIGDAIMAIFEGEPDQALFSAIEMRQIAKKIPFQYKNKIYTVRLGIGINTGELSLGALGTSERLTTTVIGNSVNLASRIESLTKHYKVPILTSQDTIDYLYDPSSFLFREVDLVRVKGIKKPTQIYELIGLSEKNHVETSLIAKEKQTI